VSFEPGAANVVPAEARVLIEYRDPSAQQLDRMQAEIASSVEEADGRGGVRATATPVAAVPPTQLDPHVADVLASAARGRGQQPLLMASGAGHDAMTLSPHLPSALLFVPSIGGRSHDVAEDTAEADIVLGAQVMADAAGELLSRTTSPDA
jgi:N-carbamoyl-L-amino-acid hydrolase